MTAECCCTVKSIALDYQSLEHSQITDESYLRCLAVNVCACVCVLAVFVLESEMKTDKDTGCVFVCKEERQNETKERENED